MSFLQPFLLFGLPLMALPIIIHLINQRRYQTTRWAAMMFLLAANRMSRGYARVRQWLILAMRVAALAGLIFAISRPLAGGWLGSAASGKPDVTILLIDRSPSMQQGAVGGGGSKLETGVRQLTGTLKTLGSGRWVVVDSGTNRAHELESIDALANSPVVGPSSAAADIPAMLQTAHDYIRDNKPGRAEVWIASDLRDNDWAPGNARWKALRDGFSAFPQGVRIHLLAYADVAPENIGLQITELRRRKTADGGELLVSLKLTREGDSPTATKVPLRFEIDGARSEMVVELVGKSAELKDHPIPLEKGHKRGWGHVAIPADANPADDDAWFAFDEPAARKTIVVAEDAAIGKTLQLAAAIPPNSETPTTAELIEPEQLPGVAWDETSLLLWQGPLPDGDVAQSVEAFIRRGGLALFFPPKNPGDEPFLGLRWAPWEESANGLPVEGWRGDADLLAHTQSGAALPVGVMQVRRWSVPTGEATPLATLRGGSPLMARVITDRGGAYFCGTTPAVGDSSLATDGVVFYVLIQRALATGSSALETARQIVAGEPPPGDPATWTRVAGGDAALSTDYDLHGGIYEAGPALLAVNRPAGEDQSGLVADDTLAELFQGLTFDRVDDRAGSLGGLIQEIWRAFLIIMLIAMVAEAALCLPKPVPAAIAATPTSRPPVGAFG